MYTSNKSTELSSGSATTGSDQSRDASPLWRGPPSRQRSFTRAYIILLLPTTAKRFDTRLKQGGSLLFLNTLTTWNGEAFFDSLLRTTRSQRLSYTYCLWRVLKQVFLTPHYKEWYSTDKRRMCRGRGATDINVNGDAVIHLVYYLGAPPLSKYLNQDNAYILYCLWPRGS